MKEHTTHFDGCDCVMEKISELNAEIAQLKEEILRLRKALLKDGNFEALKQQYGMY